MRLLNYLLISLFTLSTVTVSAAPRRRVVSKKKQHKNHSPPRAHRRIVRVQPAVKRSVVRKNRPVARTSPNRSIVQRSNRKTNRARPNRRVIQSPRVQQNSRRSNAQRRQQVQRRKHTQKKSFQKRRIQRRHEAKLHRVTHRGRQARQSHRRAQNSRSIASRKHRPLPLYVYSPPTRHIVISHYPQFNDEAFFDRMYHDGVRYGVNGDLSDEETNITKGIRKGLITPEEAQRLHSMLWEAYDLEDECIADGFLTEEEEADLYWVERDLNREIRWEMRDFDTW